MTEFNLITKSLIRFFICYLSIIVLYQLYLYYYDTQNQCDPFTTFLAYQIITLTKIIPPQTYMMKDPSALAMLLYTKKIFTVRINEGCNALSVMILFVSFIIAFPSTTKTTLRFILFGLICIHLANISRIFLLNYISITHKDYFKLIHDYIFPSIIWGSVVVLWFIWVQKIILKRLKLPTQS